MYASRGKLSTLAHSLTELCNVSYVSANSKFVYALSLSKYQPTERGDVLQKFIVFLCVYVFVLWMGGMVYGVAFAVGMAGWQIFTKTVYS